MAKPKRAKRLPKVKTGWRVSTPKGRQLVATMKADFREKGVRFLLLRVK